ncbi:MAG: type II secretion system protein GspK [Methylobacter sp.]|nr:type II secretion system protein GspK [Methylobacter sp.]MDP2097830.1 type II secretion system protein GspK [Methylobacter sp.]MDP2429100.1 type II secretion system protein GspK [Methylobacter sp.]MDP3054467.1 type II secretion system protein GspK [Methylobacter sp.]MDP3362412.1 type II secretion system protein GspK [Methylobacter sp.]
MSRQSGFALVLVLWVLSLLTIMAGSFALSMRREAAIVAGSSSHARGMAIAESGLALAGLMLMHPDPQQRWHTDSSIYQVDYADSKLRIQLLAETGKIDINSADQVLLQSLMAQTPLEAEAQTRLVNAILDWRDADDLVRIDGAEKKEYKAAGLSYQPANKPFQSIEELQLVLGMNEHVFKPLENLITIYSGQPKVDLAQAPKEVLQIVPGMDAALIDAYIAARRESAITGLPVPALVLRDGVYTLNQADPGTAAQTLRNVQPAQQSGAANTAPGLSGAITVISEALLDDGSSATLKVLVKKTDGGGASPFQILKWQRNPTAAAPLFTDEKDESLVRQYAEPQFND